MRFNMDQAWRDALNAIKGNREVLLTLAGVFVFLPGLLASLFLSGLQSQLLERVAQMQPGTKDPAAITEILKLYAQVAPWALLLLLAEAIGMMAMMALVTDHRRPTVGEALRLAIRAMPVVIGAGLLFFLAYLLVAMVGSGILAVLVTALHLPAGPVLAVAILAFLGCNLYALVRLSLTLPVVVIDGQRNPLAALKSSWALTRGNAGRLLAFYLLLMLAYIVVALVVITVPLALIALAIGREGEGFLLASGLVSGVVGMISSVLFTAILAAIHRQLAGPSASTVSSIFE